MIEYILINSVVIIQYAEPVFLQNYISTQIQAN